MVMIGAACWYAYDQTSKTLEQSLDSITEQIAVETTKTSTTNNVIWEAVTQTTTATKAVEEAIAVSSQTTATKAEVQAESTTTVTTASVTHQVVPPLSDYRVLNEFSGDELVKSETTGTWQTHNGTDLACAIDADVYAIDAGTVISVTNDALWGYTVTIDHDNGVTSRYCGLNGSLEVREGNTVQSGEKIGIVGDTADIESALETHLHIEVAKSGQYIDPLDYFVS